jgi:hypothetical protein
MSTSKSWCEVQAYTSNMQNSTVSRVSQEESIIVYILDSPCGICKYPAIDLLPLLSFRLQCLTLFCTFMPDPNVNWERAHSPSGRASRSWIKYDCECFTTLFGWDTEEWIALIKSKKLARILLRPYFYRGMTNIDLVFKQQFVDRPLDTNESLLFCLSDARRFGVVELY